MSYIGNVSRARNIPIPNRAARIKMEHRRLRSSEIAILGVRQTGRKTLANRFCAMDDGPFEEEIPSEYFYRAYFDLDDLEVNGTGDLFLSIFIFPPPSDLPEPPPTFYIQEMLNMSSMLFLCSVIERETLEALVNLLNLFYVPELPYYFIVGNKKDLDRETFPNHFTAGYARGATHNLAVNYYECSAKQNIDVNPILDEVLRQIIDEDPE